MTDITWTNDTRKLSDLVPWEHNPKRMTRKQADGLRLSIERFGFAVPFLVSPDGDIYDGHQRQALMNAIKEYGPDAVVDVRVSSRPLTDDERRELVVRLKQNQAGWDFEMLPNLYEREELLEWGFEPEELGMFPDEPTGDDPGAQVDKAAELQAKWQTATGQMWLLDSGNGYEHRLICGDCTDAAVVARVMGGEKAQALVLADAPYGVDIVKNNAVGGENLAPVGFYSPIAGDQTTDTAKRFYSACVEYGFKDFVLWGGNYFADFLPPKACWVVWDKRGDIASNNFADCELAWTSKDAPARVHKQVWMGMIKERESGKRLHPTQKPVELMEFCINLFEASIVFDGFLGSGTTMVAAHRLGRRCFGIDVDPGYCAVTLERMSGLGVTPVLVE